MTWKPGWTGRETRSGIELALLARRAVLAGARLPVRGRHAGHDSGGWTGSEGVRTATSRRLRARHARSPMQPRFQAYERCPKPDRTSCSHTHSARRGMERRQKNAIATSRFWHGRRRPPTSAVNRSETSATRPAGGSRGGAAFARPAPEEIFGKGGELLRREHAFTPLAEEGAIDDEPASVGSRQPASARSPCTRTSQRFDQDIVHAVSHQELEDFDRFAALIVAQAGPDQAADPRAGTVDL